MILVLDIGNTNVTAAVYPAHGPARGPAHGPGHGSANVPRSRWKVRRPARAGARWWIEVATLACVEAGLSPKSLRGVAISSVVPAATRVAAPALRRLTGRAPLVVSGSMRLGIRFAYPDPSKLGPDRVCGMLAASARFGLPVIVADCGTAITVDAVARGRRHAGGLIAPGITMSTRALASGTAALPETNVVAPPGPAAADTVEAIRAGAWYSAVGAVREAVAGLKKKVGRGVTVVGTGGDAAALSRETGLFDAVDPDLVAAGAAIAWRLTSRRRAR